MTGLFNYTATIGSLTLTAPLSTAAYLVKLDASGNTFWGRAMGFDSTGGSVGAANVAVDSAGNVAMVGSVSGGVDFGSGQATYGSANIYVAKYNPQGKYLWVKRTSNTSWTAGYGIATDGDRNVYATGFMNGDVTLEGLQASSPGIQSKSAFLLKVSP